MYRFKDILTAHNDRKVIDSLQTHPPVSSLEDQGKCSVTKKVTLTVLKLIHTLHNFSPSRLSPLVWLAEGQTPSLSPVQLTLNSAAIYTDSSPLRFLHAWGGHHLRTGTPLEDKKKQVKTSLTLNFCMHHKTTYLLLSSSDLLSPSRYCTVSWLSFKTANSQLCCDLAIARRDRSRLDAIVYVR